MIGYDHRFPVKTVVVLGMHRSGTSLIAGMLHKLGVNMGRKQVGVHWSNPLGHYENVDFLKCDDRILKAAGGSWDNPPQLSSILSLRNKREIVDMIKKTILRNEEMFWGWKVPTTCLTVELYYPYLKNPFFIVCYRDVYRIVESLNRRDGTPYEKGYELVEIYNDSICNFLEKYDVNYINFKYENIIRNPKQAVIKLAKSLGLELDRRRLESAIALVMPPKKIKELQKNLKKKEIYLLLKDFIENPYLVRRYLFRCLKNPDYALRKMGLK